MRFGRGALLARSYDIAEFNSSDGLTPMQTAKLNANFRRVAQLAQVEAPAVKPDVDVSEVVSLVMPQVYAAMADYLLPVGTVLIVNDEWEAPYGTWVEVTSHKGRYLRMWDGDDPVYGQHGGHASRTVEVPLPEHSHGYLRPDASVAVEAAPGGTGAMASVLEPDDTDPAGVDPAEVEVTLDPEYVTVRMVRRTA